MRFLAPIAFAAPLIAGLGALALSGTAAAAALVVPIDQSTRLNISGAAASVLVGNPSVADVTVIDSHTLYILGRGYGATDLVVLDREGRPLYTSDLVVSSNDAGRVSVYRGPTRTDMACAPACQTSLRSTGSGSSGGGSSSSGGGGGGGGGGLAGAVGAMTGGVASGASAAGAALGGGAPAASAPAPR